MAGLASSVKQETKQEDNILLKYSLKLLSIPMGSSYKDDNYRNQMMSSFQKRKFNFGKLS